MPRAAIEVKMKPGFRPVDVLNSHFNAYLDAMDATPESHPAYAAATSLAAGILALRKSVERDEIPKIEVVRALYDEHWNNRENSFGSDVGIASMLAPLHFGRASAIPDEFVWEEFERSLERTEQIAYVKEEYVL